MNLNQSFDVIGVSETWDSFENPIATNVEIPGYDLVFTRSHSQNGGVGIYVKSNLSASPRKDLDCSNDDFETVWIEVDRKNEKNLLFCCVYRHPNSNVESLTFHLNDVLLKVTQQARRSVFQIGGAPICAEAESVKNLGVRSSRKNVSSRGLYFLGNTLL